MYMDISVWMNSKVNVSESGKVNVNMIASIDQYYENVKVNKFEC